MNRLALLFLTALAATAQTPQTLTIQQAVRMALERNPDALLAQVEAEKAAQDIDVAKGAFSPAAYVGSGLGWTSGIPQSVEGATPSVVQATARKTVYDRGLLKRVEQARAGSRAAELSAAAREEEIAFRVAATFLDFERAARHVTLLEAETDRVRNVLETIAARVDDGRAIPLEASKARLDLARAQQSLAAAQGARDLLEATLRVDLALPADTQIRPAPTQALPLADLPGDPTAAASAALETSSEIRSLEQAAVAKGVAIEAEKGARYPRLDLVAQYSLLAKFNNYEEFFNRFQRHNGQVGLALSVPVFTGKAVSSRVAKAAIEAREADLQLAARRSAVEAETYRLFQVVQDADGRRTLAKLELDYARESLDVTLARFDEGEVPLDAVDRARLTESHAWQRYYDAQYEAQKAKLDLLRRTGDLTAALR